MLFLSTLFLSTYVRHHCRYLYRRQWWWQQMGNRCNDSEPQRGSGLPEGLGHQPRAENEIIENKVISPLLQGIHIKTGLVRRHDGKEQIEGRARNYLNDEAAHSEQWQKAEFVAQCENWGFTIAIKLRCAPGFRRLLIAIITRFLVNTIDRQGFLGAFEAHDSSTPPAVVTSVELQ